MDEAIERITAAEKAFANLVAANERLSAALEAYDAALDDLELFSDYYGSEEWFDDYDADGRGELPEDLPRGVLSEDVPYDVLIGTRSLALSMLEIATDTLYLV